MRLSDERASKKPCARCLYRVGMQPQQIRPLVVIPDKKASRLVAWFHDLKDEHKQARRSRKVAQMSRKAHKTLLLKNGAGCIRCLLSVGKSALHVSKLWELSSSSVSVVCKKNSIKRYVGRLRKVPFVGPCIQCGSPLKTVGAKRFCSLKCSFDYDFNQIPNRRLIVALYYCEKIGVRRVAAITGTDRARVIGVLKHYGLYRGEAGATERYRNVIDWGRHPEVLRYRAKRLKQREEYIKKNPQKYNSFRIRKALSSRLSLSMRGLKAGRSLTRFIGCSVDTLKQHIEKQFVGGMSWSNYASHWEIDHILPCSIFNHAIESEVLQCWNWQNLRPLEKEENRQKRDRVTEPQQHLTLNFLQESP